MSQLTIIHRRPRSRKLLVLALASVTSLGAHELAAGTCGVFGPTLYQRQTGKPVALSATFSVANAVAPAVLRIHNGADGQLPKVSSAVVTLNGVSVAAPCDFNQTVTLIEKPVTLLSSNEITVELRSAPGSGFLLEVNQIDNEPPLITAAASPAANAFGWNNADVTVSFTCSDAICGIATCPSPVTVASEGAHQVVSGTAIDRAGNQATASVAVSLDKTRPVILGSVDPSPDTEGWNTSNAVVSFRCWDRLSGLAAHCPAATAVTTPGAGQVFSGAATDKADNAATATVTVNLRMPEGTIDGSVHPELIPDVAAYGMLFHAVAQPTGVTDRGRARTRALLGPAGLSDTDVDGLITAANELRAQLRPLEQQAAALRESVWPDPGPGTMSQLAALQQQKDQLVEQMRSSLTDRLGSEAAGKLSSFMDSYFKNRIQSVPDAALPPATRPPEN
jgi:hypothetical protein